MSDGDWEVAEIGRVLYAHRLDPALACEVLGIDAEQATRLGTLGDVVSCRGNDTAERAALLLNTLLRVELRCAHDPRAIAAALERPVPELGGTSIGAALRAPIDVAMLRQLRCAAGAMPMPKVKMWRAADRYS